MKPAQRETAPADLGQLPHEITTLLEILDTITSSLDLQEVTHTIVHKLAAIVPSARCSLLCLDETKAKCHVMASHDDPDLEMLEVDLGKYPEIKSAIKTRKPIVINDSMSDPLTAGVRAQLKKRDYRSIVVVPMTFGSDVLGTLCLKTARSKHEFSQKEITYCVAVARASASALKNAILHFRVQSESKRFRGALEQLTRILDHSPDVILTTDTRGRITEFNRCAERLLGYPKDEVQGKPFNLLLGDVEDAGLLDRVRSGGTLSNHACRLRKKDGTDLETELNLSVLKDEAGVAAGTVWVGRDVSELKSTQLQLMQAEKLSSMGEVIAGIAHELSNPLSGVLGFSQLLMAREGSGPLARDLERIHESATRCQKIVKNLLSFARLHKPERAYLGVNGIIEKTLDLKKYQLRVNNIELVSELDPELPRTMIDFHQIQQVFLNLLNNAEHAITAVPGRRGRITIRTSHGNGFIRVSFTDNGEGMDENTLKRVFDPFFTTKEHGQGTGLGLSVSYGIVKEHGGQIVGQSRKGKGCTFTMELPIWKQDKTTGATDQSVKSASPSPPAGKRILVVDDEPVLLDLLIELLNKSGHKPDTAASGEEAFRKIRSGHYDLVITDVRMPLMNGIELYRRILVLRPDLEGRVIFITGDLLNEETARSLAQMSVRTVAKPIDASQMMAAIGETIQAAR